MKNIFKKLFIVILCLSSFMFFISCSNGSDSQVENVVEETNEEINEGPKMNSYVLNDFSEDEIVKIELSVKDYGVIKMELNATKAPKTVENFIKLVNNKFYDGLTFHRIISGFMIQGGDPNGNGTGGSKENIVGEFSANNIENDISHVRGVVSMARAMDYDSASSQFFICHEDSTFLDGQYAGFGKVTEGMEVVDKICEKVIPIDDNGTVLKENQPVIEYIKVIS